MPILFAYHFHRDFQAKKKKEKHSMIYSVIFTPYSGIVSPNDKTIDEICKACQRCLPFLVQNRSNTMI